MLPLILLAGGAYLIANAVLEDDKYAEGGMITSISEAKKVVGNVQKSNNEHFSWFVPDVDYEGEDYDQEYGVHLTDSELIQLANELKGGYMAKGGKIVNEYKLVFKNDKGDYLSHYTEGVSIGDAYKVGKWREENTYGREGYKFIPSMTKLVANDIVSGTFEAGSDWMEDEFDEARPFKINRKMAKGGKAKDYDGEKYKVADVYYSDRRKDLFIVTESKPTYIVVKYKDGFVDKITKEELKELKDSGDLDYLGKNVDLLDKYIFKDAFAKGGKTQGYDDREDERLAMKHGKISKKDLKSTHSRRDDARFEERGKMAKGGEVKDYSGNYYSTYDFVSVNKLEKEADSLFGKDWEAEDDASQILELTDSLGGGYTTYVSEDDEDWQRLRYKHSLNNETNDSNYDIFVVHYGRKKKK
jgi:hypothetical protein